EEVLTETAEAVEGGGAERQTGSAEPVCPYRVVIVFGPAGAHAPHAPMHLGPPEVRRALAGHHERGDEGERILRDVSGEGAQHVHRGDGIRVQSDERAVPARASCSNTPIDPGTEAV